MVHYHITIWLNKQYNNTIIKDNTYIIEMTVLKENTYIAQNTYMIDSCSK